MKRGIFTLVQQTVFRIRKGVSRIYGKTGKLILKIAAPYEFPTIFIMIKGVPPCCEPTKFAA